MSGESGAHPADVPSQAHVELLQLFLANRDEIVERLQGVLNAQRKPIEYLPSSWCGNSYHTVFLGPKQYWEFAAPRYNGKIKTRLRIRLEWQKSQFQKLTIYSNEFDGSVNAKQFTVQQGHQPTNIMDPYNN